MGRLSWWAQCNHKGPYKKESGRSETEERDGTVEAEVGMTALKTEEGAMSQGILAAPRSWEKGNTSLKPPERMQACRQRWYFSSPCPWLSQMRDDGPTAVSGVESWGLVPGWAWPILLRQPVTSTAAPRVRRGPRRH